MSRQRTTSKGKSAWKSDWKSDNFFTQLAPPRRFKMSVSRHSLSLALAGGGTVAMILGLIYGFACQWIAKDLWPKSPLSAMVLAILWPACLGVLAGVAPTMLLTRIRGHVIRNMDVAIQVCIGVGAMAVYASWALWSAHVSGDSLAASMLPWRIAESMSVNALVSGANVFGHSIPKLVLWFGELSLVLAASAICPLVSYRTHGFCPACDGHMVAQGTSPRYPTMRLDATAIAMTPANLDWLAARLLASDFSVLRKLKVVPPSFVPTGKFLECHIDLCEDCEHSAALRVSAVAANGWLGSRSARVVKMELTLAEADGLLKHFRPVSCPQELDELLAKLA